VTDREWLRGQTEQLAEGVVRLEAGGVPAPALPEGAREAIAAVYERDVFDAEAKLVVLRQWLGGQEGGAGEEEAETP
jgi:hypothetical protein